MKDQDAELAEKNAEMYDLMVELLEKGQITDVIEALKEQSISNRSFAKCLRSHSIKPEDK